LIIFDPNSISLVPTTAIVPFRLVAGGAFKEQMAVAVAGIVAIGPYIVPIPREFINVLPDLSGSFFPYENDWHRYILLNNG
jgi:hypothetical protein